MGLLGTKARAGEYSRPDARVSPIRLRISDAVERTGQPQLADVCHQIFGTAEGWSCCTWVDGLSHVDAGLRSDGY